MSRSPTPTSSSAAIPGPTDRDHDARFGREVLPLAAEVHRFALALCGSDVAAQRLVVATLRRAYRLSLGPCPNQAGVVGTPMEEQARRLLTLCRELFGESGDSYSEPGSTAISAGADLGADILGSGRVFATTLRDGLEKPWAGARDVDALLAALPSQNRVPVVLVDVAGLPDATAAQVLGIDALELRARLFHGRRLLQERVLEAQLMDPRIKRQMRHE
jgi:DNA-directed RNA polymerase specialized sigma24 family protein